MTTRSLTHVLAATVLAAALAPSLAHADPPAAGDDDDDADCDDDSDDCDAEGNIEAGCDATIAPDAVGGIGGLLFTLGLVAVSLGRRRAP